MAKENEDPNETGAALPPSSTETDSEKASGAQTDSRKTTLPQIEENKENQLDDPSTAFETELKLANSKSDVFPSADIDKVTADLLQSRTDLLGRVQNLKKDLQDWRGKLDSQVKTYRQELGELRSTLNSEVEQLRNEFQALRTTLKRQLDATNSLGEQGSKSLEKGKSAT